MDLQLMDQGTALFLAASNNKLDIARYLCERGANTLLKGYGGTSYAWACSKHGADSQIARLLEAYPH